MLLTIAIPTYNRAESLRITLQSFMAEIERFGLREIEIVVSDNCSTDNTQIVCIGLAALHPHINFRYFKNTSNLGFDGNVNALFYYAEGNYVWTFSDDDQLEPGALAHAVNLLKQSIVNFAFVNYEINIEGKIISSRFGIGGDYWLEANQVLKHIRFSNSLISSCIFSKEAWLRSNPERFLGTLWIHFFVAREILQAGNGLVIGKPLFTMMQSGLKKSRSEKRNRNSHEIEFYMLAHLKFIEFSSQLSEYAFDKKTIEIAYDIGRKEDIHQIVNFKLTTPKYSVIQLLKTWKKMAEFRKNEIRFWVLVTPLIFSPSWTIKTAHAAYKKIK